MLSGTSYFLASTTEPQLNNAFMRLCSPLRVTMHDSRKFNAEIKVASILSSLGSEESRMSALHARFPASRQSSFRPIPTDVLIRNGEYRRPAEIRQLPTSLPRLCRTSYVLEIGE